MKFIAIFDSGFGGLSYFSRLKEENIIYIADSLNAPYGEKTKKEIIENTLKACSFLKKKPIKYLLLACNTASIYAYEEIKKKFPFPVFEIITSGVSFLKKEKNVTILATKASIRSNFFEKKIRKINKKIKIFKKSCPEVVNFIERGILEGDALEKNIRNCIYRIKEEGPIYLGCSHYILVKDIFSFFTSKKIIDPSLAYMETKKNIQKPKHLFYTSKNLQEFKKIAEKILKEKIQVRKL